MYESQFLLKRRPFAVTPDSRCFLAAEPIQPALDELVVCVEQGQGIAVLTGPAGTGKTLLCERLRSELESAYDVVFLGHSGFQSRRALLQSILAELHHAYRRQDEQELRLQLVSAIRSLKPRRQALVLICDEAHLLTEELLEELRILSDLADHGMPLVRLVLVGQPGLEETLARSSLEALNQRIRAHICMAPLDHSVSRDYIDYRITWAGGRIEEVFTGEAIDLICRASQGVPRCINQLSDHALLLAYVAEERPVSDGTVREALKDLRQLPLHWDESLVSTDPRTALTITESQMAVDREPAGLIESVEIGADLPDSSIPAPSGKAKSESTVGAVEWPPIEDVRESESMLEFAELGIQDPLDRLPMVSELDDEPPIMIAPRLETAVPAGPLPAPTEILEEVVWDRYAAIDGGFPIPETDPSIVALPAEMPAMRFESDIPHATEVRADHPEPRNESHVHWAPPTIADGDDDAGEGRFEAVCDRLESRLPETGPDWTFNSQSYAAPHVELPGDDTSLESELGRTIYELTQEVQAESRPEVELGSACQQLQAILRKPLESVCIEVGSDDAPQTVATTEERIRESSRPYRNLFSQLRRKQKGLL